MKEISKKNFDGYKYVDGGVCAAKALRLTVFIAA